MHEIFHKLLKIWHGMKFKHLILFYNKICYVHADFARLSV